MNLIRKHWNGEFPLAISYWMIGIIFNIIFTLILMILFEAAVSIFLRPTIGLVLMLITQLAITIIFGIWVLVGIWRSANRYRLENQKRKLWATVAQIMIVLSWLALIGNITESLTIIKTIILAANESNLISGSVVSVSENDGIYLMVDGHLTFSVADVIKNHLIRNPEIKTIVINSNGGYIGAGREIGDLVRLHALTILINGNCLSACTMVLAASPFPTMTPFAQTAIGFHSPISIGVKEADQGSQRMMLDYFRQQNVDEYVIKQIRKTNGDDMWTPTMAELINYNIIKLIFDGEYYDAIEWCTNNPVVCNEPRSWQ